MSDRTPHNVPPACPEFERLLLLFAWDDLDVAQRADVEDHLRRCEACSAALAKERRLLEVLAHKQISVEICISSNLRTGAITELSKHPVRRFFEEGLMVTLNTDDPAMFQTTLNKEYEIAQQEFGFSEEHLRELARNSFEASFLPVDKKVRFLQQIDTFAKS